MLPEGGAAAKSEAYVCCKENALGLPDFCKQRGWELFVTADKDGKDSGAVRLPLLLVTLHTAQCGSMLLPRIHWGTLSEHGCHAVGQGRPNWLHSWQACCGVRRLAL